MKCMICGRHFVALGVHLRRKHAVSPDDYRDEFGMLRTAPLVDEELSAQLRSSALGRLKDAEYLDEVQRRCRENAQRNTGKPHPGMSKAGRENLSERNADANKAYLLAKSGEAGAHLKSSVVMLDAMRATGSARNTVMKAASIAGVAYDANKAKEERARRIAASLRNKAAARVALVMPYWETTRSAVEMCRLAGISIKTYKNWLAAGLIQRHPNGRGKKPKN